MKLYYYTGHKFLRKILRERMVKLSRYGRFGALNDPFEFAPYDISDPQVRSIHKDAIDEIAKIAGLICLSKTRYSPAMWAHYTDNHEGACLEIEVKFDPIIKVNYETIKLFQGISLANFSKYINEANFEEILSTKSKDWSYEKERRMLVPLDHEVVIKNDEGHFMPFQKIEGNTFMLKRVVQYGHFKHYGRCKELPP